MQLPTELSKLAFDGCKPFVDLFLTTTLFSYGIDGKQRLFLKNNLILIGKAKATIC